jgi:hypothetical protein
MTFYIASLRTMQQVNSYYQSNIMSGKLPGSVEQRLKAAQELLQRSKEKGEQSPNFTRIVITFRRETLINSLLHSQTQVQAELLTEYILYYPD